MVVSLDFDLDMFLTLPMKERAKLCRKLAARASRLAKTAEADHRKDYEEVAKQWLFLAQELDGSQR